MRKQIWVTEGDFCGATGIDSVEEFAELALSDGSAAGDSFEHIEPQTIDGVVAYLIAEGVECLRVPVAVFHMESWPDGSATPMAYDERPGRGYVKVFGVGL